MKWQSPQMAFKIPNVTFIASETITYTFWECSCYLQIMKLWVSCYIWLVLFLYLIMFCQSKFHKNREQKTQMNRIWCSTFSFQFVYYSQVLRAVQQFTIYVHISEFIAQLPSHRMGNTRFFVHQIIVSVLFWYHDCIPPFLLQAPFNLQPFSQHSDGSIQFYAKMATVEFCIQYFISIKFSGFIYL